MAKLPGGEMTGKQARLTILQESDKQGMESVSSCHAIKLLHVYCLFLSISPPKTNRVQIN